MGWLIVGAIAGAVARNVMGSRDASMVNDIILGLIGAVVGGFVAGLLGLGPSPASAGLERVIINLVIAIVGAIIVIAIGRALRRAT
ncbi:MAG: GlsB/YeaQ/YmgE family stress response membrane protein [Anaerolineae bacterium]|nr:GlsB/YeaQ/YmgE family stress response membrane protein [Anaerolineae bacterium]